MKRILYILIALCCTIQLSAQTPKLLGSNVRSDIQQIITKLELDSPFKLKLLKNTAGNKVLTTDANGYAKLIPISDVNIHVAGWGLNLLVDTFKVDSSVLDARYLRSNYANIANWNTAYGWGNHASAGYELQSNKSTAIILGTSDVLYPSQKAVKTYVDNALSAIDLSAYLTTSTAASTYLKFTDTSTMLAAYERAAHATATYSQLGHTHTFSSITSKPTTLSGYGITDAQPIDADLTTLAALTPANDDVMQYKAGAWANRTLTQLKSDLSLSGTNTGDQDLSGYSLTSHTHTFASLTSKPTTLSGYGITDAQPLDADLTTIAGLTATTDNFIVSSASAWASRTPAQVKTTLSLNSVENTALSTWAGTTNITTLGTISTGTWNGTAIGATYLPTAVSNGTTKGISTFTAADFNDASGVISIDYTNGQAASASNKGFLTSANWTTFNNKLGTSGGVANYMLVYNTSTVATISNIQENGSGMGVYSSPTAGYRLTVANGSTGAATFGGDINISSGNLLIPSGNYLKIANGSFTLTGSTGTGYCDISTNVGGYEGRLCYNRSGTPTPFFHWIEKSGTDVEIGVQNNGYLNLGSTIPGSFTNNSIGSDGTNMYFRSGGVNYQIDRQTTSGTATLSSGTVTVSTSAALTGSRIVVTYNTPSGTLAAGLSVPSASIVNGTSFVINSLTTAGAVNTLDNSTVNWVISKN